MNIQQLLYTKNNIKYKNNFCINVMRIYGSKLPLRINTAYSHEITFSIQTKKHTISLKHLFLHKKSSSGKNLQTSFATNTINKQTSIPH